MHDEEKTFKQALNESLRRALRPGGARVNRRRFRVRPHNSQFRPGIDPARLNQLADQLDVDDSRAR